MAQRMVRLDLPASHIVCYAKGAYQRTSRGFIIAVAFVDYSSRHGGV